MKKLIIIAALGAILLSVSPLVFAGEQEGPVFEPRPNPPNSTQLAQGAQIILPDHDTQGPLNPDVRG